VSAEPLARLYGQGTDAVGRGKALHAQPPASLTAEARRRRAHFARAVIDSRYAAGRATPSTSIV